MTTRSLILHPHEVLAALGGELGVIVRLVKPQPAYIDITSPGWTGASVDSKPDDEPIEFKCPLGVPGTQLVCKETWTYAYESDAE